MCCHGCFSLHIVRVEEAFLNRPSQDTFNKSSSLNSEEKASMNVLLRGAAVRILVTRLYDKIFHPNEGLNELKDPEEYLKILKWHQINKDLNL